MKIKAFFSLSILSVSVFSAIAAANPSMSDPSFIAAQAMLEKAKKTPPLNGKAKNIIVFIGDGMSIGTITAGRIYAGQQAGKTGEESILAMDTLPHVALSKTYNTDMQTPDSAGTATAIMTGYKTKAGVINVNDKVIRGNCQSMKGNQVDSLFDQAAQEGKALGVISTARITHATPATTYAHSADRDWENNAALPKDAAKYGCEDIAAQFVKYNEGNGFQVTFGGGRREFQPTSVADIEYRDKHGKRTDGRDLIQEWKERYPTGQYVYDTAGFNQIKIDENTRVLGLFEPSHLEYEVDRKAKNNEPTLAEMTNKAIDILEQDKDGYVLMVEAGRIDHAHHDGNAARALEDTVAFDNAIKVALEKTNPKDTLIIVTADHAHTMVMNGYAERGNPILGLSKKAGEFNEDTDGKKFTTIVYGNGPGAIHGHRPDVKEEEAAHIDYKQQALIHLDYETHSGEDVAIFAQGPQAWLFQGTVEQNYIYHVMKDAAELKK